MRAFIFGLLFVSLTAHAGPAVSGGNVGVCDPEKEAVLQTFFDSDLALKSVILSFADAKFRKSCTIGSSNLVKPNALGVESNDFSVEFSNETDIYTITIRYKAQRSGMNSEYKGHAPGDQDGTVLQTPELVRFTVVPGKVSTGFSIGF